MPKRSYTNFSGGKDTKNQGTTIADEFPDALSICQDAKDWMMTKAGLEKFPGYLSVFSSIIGSSITITGAFVYVTAAGAQKLIVCANGNVYEVVGATKTSLISGQSTTAFYQAIQYKDKLLLMNGVNKVLEYNVAKCYLDSSLNSQYV